VAVTDDDRLIAVLPGDESRTHGERLPGEIARVLDLANVSRDRIDLLAVATGPGAFTGLRIGLAAMQGLAMTLNRPVIGISALDALAEQARDAGAQIIAPWMDAQRGDVFATLIAADAGTTIEAPAAANPTLLLDAWATHLAGRRVLFIGDAVARDRALIEAIGPQVQVRIPGPLAPQIAILGRRGAANGEAGAPHALEPIYVRRPDAEIERERRGRRGGDGDGGEGRA